MKTEWKLHHLGYVVRNLEAAMDYYEGFGLGSRGEIRDFKTATGAVLRIGNMRVGNIELELFQPVTGESRQSAFLAAHGEGIQHIGFTVRDIEEEAEALVRQGAKLITRGSPPIGKIAFFDTGEIGGVLLELVEPAC